jgi:6-phosphogluconolactonase
VKLVPGTGPRHLAISQAGDVVYSINELASTITVFSYHAGVLGELQSVSALPAGFNGINTSAELAIDPSGRSLYASNRGADDIAVFAIKKDGRLSPIEHQSSGGKNPRGFGIDPTGRFLVAGNQGTNSLVVFRLNPESGSLQPTGQTLSVGSPVCVVFVPVMPTHSQGLQLLETAGFLDRHGR